MKTQTLEKGKDTKIPDNERFARKIYTLVTACHAQETDLAGHNYSGKTATYTPPNQAPTSETENEPETKPAFAPIPWMESNMEPKTSPKHKKKRRERY